MTKYKAFMPFVMIVVVAVAAIAWSPQLVDAVEVAQEGDPVQIPVLTTATLINFADTRDWTAIPETFTTLADYHQTDSPLADFAKASSSVAAGESAEDEESPSCRRVCVRETEVCATACDNAGNCNTECVTVCCRWDLIDCYMG